MSEKLEKDPGSVRLLLQFIESSRPDPDHAEYIQRAIDAVEAKHTEWEAFGPVIFRYAVLAAKERGMPQLNQWVARARELFPNSFYVKIDIAYYLFMYYLDQERYSDCISCGEEYLEAIAEYEAGKGDQTALLYSTLHTASPRWKQTLRTGLASACQKTGRAERAIELLEDIQPLDSDLMRELLQALWELQVTTVKDTGPHILRLYEQITDEPDEKRATELMTAFLQTAPQAFSPDVREKEAAREDFHRYSYTVFLPLAGKCEVGTAAAVMEAESVQEIDKLLGMVESWGDFSVSALIHALEKGASFPPEGKTMRLEEMERIVKRLSQYQGRFFEMVSRTAPKQCNGSWQQLTWARSMVLSAVQGFDWKDEKLGLALADAFAKVEGAFVARCYTPEVLCEENLYVLPSMHRFGWYCGRAFEALESGDAKGYVRLLRSGLEACPNMKPMVEFLTKHTPQLKPPVPGELLALAEKVRTMLSAYEPDDPMVAAVKQSAAYQKVAHLIEGPGPGIFGGSAQ